MLIYKKENDKLLNIIEKPFAFEKDIQSLCENNLEELFNLKLVKSEFKLSKFKFDSLAFDKELNSFVIIEYKRDKNLSVIDTKVLPILKQC